MDMGRRNVGEPRIGYYKLDLCLIVINGQYCRATGCCLHGSRAFVDTLQVRCPLSFTIIITSTAAKDS
jgi:hypothetical protein